MQACAGKGQILKAKSHLSFQHHVLSDEYIDVCLRLLLAKIFLLFFLKFI